MGNIISDGSLVLLYFDVKRQWLIRIENSRQFHTHKGFIALADLIGRPFGSEVKSSLGYSFCALKPTTHDFIMHSARKTQIMYPKDIGLIILKLALSPGLKILEIGTGSGAMTLAAATAVKPTGHVHTYEARVEFAEMAERNLRRAAVFDYVTIHNSDACAGIEGLDFDRGYNGCWRPLAFDSACAQSSFRWLTRGLLQPHVQPGREEYCGFRKGRIREHSYH